MWPVRSEETEISTDLDRIRHLPEGPLKMTEFALWWVHKAVFTKPTNPGDLRRDVGAGVIELLGREYFEPGWGISYSFCDEALNLRTASQSVTRSIRRGTDSP